MRAAHHRFFQSFAPGLKTPRWQEVSDDGSARSIFNVRIKLPGHLLRLVQSWFRRVLKTLARALYLSPLLIVVKLLLQFLDVPGSNYVTVAFVALVVCFFAMLNVYILWAVIIHVFGHRGAIVVVPPFTDDGEDRAGVFSARLEARPGLEPTMFRGKIARVDGLLPKSEAQVLRDMWAVPLCRRLTEAANFAVVGDGDEQPHVLHFQSAPLVVSRPQELTMDESLQRMGDGLAESFGMETRQSSPTQNLTLSEGDEVEIRGFVGGEITNVNHFTLDDRVCCLERRDQPGPSPYRGDNRDPATLVVATAEAPLWIRKL